MSASKTDKQKKPAPKQKGVVSFLIAVLKSFIVALIWLVLGTTYATVSHSDNLETIFPTELSLQPYSNTDPEGKKSPLDMFKANKYSAPYTLCPTPSDCEGFGGSFKEWLQKSIEFSYVNGRKAMHGVLKTSSALDDALGKKNALNTTVSAFFGPILIFVLIGLANPFGLISNLIGQFNQGHWGWGLGMLLLGLGPALASVIGTTQSIQTFITFFGYGTYLSGVSFKQVLASNKNLFMGIFGLLVVLNAFDHFSVWGGVSAALVYAGVMFGFL